ncbi:hypothetical protein LZ554_006216 [Drepanopeziza brunnea f. sp. 'monogermtubi']|nr:hypothetical protein LZ554_006216 [Drepanopeziza brunnea f. sp. 'monogermtubi']
MSKEATIYVVDLGSTTAECQGGRETSDLEYSLEYVRGALGEIMAKNRKNLSVGVVGFRTDETDNPLSDDDGYDNITVLKQLGEMDMPSYEELRPKLVSSGTDAGDAISAIVVAAQLMDEGTRLKSGGQAKFVRKIVLVTDGQGRIEDDNIEPIAKQLDELNIRLVVLGVDFDDAEYGFKEEDKSSVKRDNEKLLRKLAESCKDGDFGTMAEAVDFLKIPAIKVIRPFKAYGGRLGLGDYVKYPESALFIDVERYSKTKRATAPSASNFVVSRAAAINGDGDTEMTDAPLAAVKNRRDYHIVDESASQGKAIVDRTELAKGYYYGSTAVPFGEDAEAETRFKSNESFSIIGFIPNDKYERFLNMGEACVTIAEPTNDKARMAMSSLVHALDETESYAVARLVKKDGAGPVILLMAPLIDLDIECLVDVPLPFAEDVRNYKFPPLDKVMGISGNVIMKHRYLPADNEVQAMSDYVDSMDLSSFGRDEEGKPKEYMPIEEMYAPMVHRLQHAISHRAMQPDKPVPKPAEILLKWSHPPSDLVAKASPQLEALKNAVKVSKVPPKTKGKRGGREVVKPMSNLDIDGLLSESGRGTEVSADNEIPSFKQMIASDPDDEDLFVDASKQLCQHIRGRIKTSSLDTSSFDRAFGAMTVLRKTAIEYELPCVYNDFLRDLKEKIFNGELGGDRTGFWQLLTKKRLGLIQVPPPDSDKVGLDTAPGSDVTEQEAADFLKPPMRDVDME